MSIKIKPDNSSAKDEKPQVLLLDITGTDPLYMEIMYAVMKHQPKIKEVDPRAIKDALEALAAAVGELLHLPLAADGEMAYAVVWTYVQDKIVERVASITVHHDEILERHKKEQAERRPS